MANTDPLIESLIALCKKEGGTGFVADKAKVSQENLNQIIKGVKLPSGQPRAVGARLRKKISEAYPDWIAKTAAPAVDELSSIRHIYRAIHPEFKAAAMNAVISAMTPFLSHPATDGHSQDALDTKLSEVSQSSPGLHKTP